MKPLLPPPKPGQRRFRKVPQHIQEMVRKEHQSISYAELSTKYNLSPSVLWYIRKGIKFPSHYKHKQKQPTNN